RTKERAPAAPDRFDTRLVLALGFRSNRAKEKARSNGAFSGGGGIRTPQFGPYPADLPMAPGTPVEHEGARSAMIVCMSEKPTARSVKISADERTGWSSERPRGNGGTARPVDVSVRCRVLVPTHRLRYSPGSLLIIIGPEASDPARFAERAVEERGAILAASRVRALLAGR